MKRFFADDLKTFSGILFSVALAAVLVIGIYACIVVAETVTDNAEKAALSHLRSSDSVLTEKTKNIQRFVDLANVNPVLKRLMNDETGREDEFFSLMRSLTEGFEEIDGCVLLNDRGKGYIYNLQSLKEEHLIQLQISCSHMSGKIGVLNWFNIDLGEATNPIFNKYIICGTTVFNDKTARLYMFVRKELFNQIISSTVDDAIFAVLDEEGNIIFSNDEVLFRSRFNASGSNLFSTYALTQGLFEFEADGRAYVGVHSQSGYSSFKFLELYPKCSFYSDLYKIAFVVGLITGTSLLLLIILYHIFRKRFVLPLATLSHMMRHFDAEMLHQTIDISGSREIDKIVDGFNKMIGRVNDMIENVKCKETEKKQAELSALRYQIRPHFLYNTLNSIRILALYNKQNDIAKSIQILARMMQNLFSHKSMITLSQEMTFIHDYVDLLQLRYKNKIEVFYQTEDSVADCIIPNMLLQPVVENAVSHGLAAKLVEPSESARLYINIYRQEDDLLLEVTDNGVGMSPEEIDAILCSESDSTTEKIGLRNISERVKLLYGEAYGLSVTSQKGLFTTVTVRLPARCL